MRGPYSKRRMRFYAVLGPILSLVVLGFGIKGAVEGSSAAALMLAIGALTLVFFVVMIPLARRRGRL